MNKENEEVRYLPVLYTVPFWKLKRMLGKQSSEYLNPWTGEYFRGKGFRKLGIKAQDFYDRWVLNITVPSERPKCEICGDECEFVDLCMGYRSMCHRKECKSAVRSKRNKERYKDEEQRKKTGELTSKSWKNPEHRQNRISGLRKHYDEWTEEDRKAWSELCRANLTAPGMHEKLSKSISQAHQDGKYDGVFKGSGIMTHIYSIWEEKEFWTDSSYEATFVYYMELKYGLSVNLIREFIKIRIPKPSNGCGYGSYLVDFFLQMNGKQYLVEVKPNYQLENDSTIAKMNEAIDFCYLLGLEYVIITEDFLFSKGRPFYGDLGFLMDDDSVLKSVGDRKSADKNIPGKVKKGHGKLR